MTLVYHSPFTKECVTIFWVIVYQTRLVHNRYQRLSMIKYGELSGLAKNNLKIFIFYSTTQWIFSNCYKKANANLW